MRKYRNILFPLQMLCCLVSIVLFICNFSGKNTSAETLGWITADGNLETMGTNQVLLTGGEKDVTGGINRTYLRAKYSYTLDLISGYEFAYYLPDEESLSIGEEVISFENPLGSTLQEKGNIIDNARYYGHSYVQFTAINPENGIGFEVTFFHQYSDSNYARPNHTEINLNYIDPDITADETQNKTNGRHYAETIYSYEKNFQAWHTVSCYKFNNMFYISADGSCFVPLSDYSDMDLSAAVVTVETKSIDTENPKLLLKSPTPNFKRHNFGNWTTLGESQISQNFDGTYRVEVTEKNDLLLSAPDAYGHLVLRERVISTVGFSVDQPIVLEFSHDLRNSPAYWLAIHLATDPFRGTAPLKFNSLGRGISMTEMPFQSNYLANNGGFYVLSKELRAFTYGASGISYSFVTKNNEDIYEKHADLDKIEIIVDSSTTKVYYNGKYAFDLKMNRQDFASSGYMAFPYFLFDEMPPNSSRSNVLHLKGANAPLNNGSKVVKYKDSYDQDPQINLEVYGQETEFYLNKELTLPLENDYYTFEDNLLTIKQSFFAGKEHRLYEIFAKTKGGIEYLKIRYLDESTLDKPPELANIMNIPAELKSNAVYYVKGLDNDIFFNMEMYDMSFLRLYGSGIRKVQYSFNATTNRMLIKNDFLKGLDYGTYIFYFESVDRDGEIYSTQVDLKVVKTAREVVWVPAEITDGEGCSGNYSYSLPVLFLAATLIGSSSRCFKKQKGENRHEN